MPIFALCIFSDLPSATLRIDIRSLEDGGVYFNMFLKYMQFLDGIRLCRSSGKRLLPPSKEVHHVRPLGLGLGGRGWSADLRPRMVPPPVSVASWHIHMLRHHLLFLDQLVIISRCCLLGLLKDLVVLILLLIWMLGGTQFILANSRSVVSSRRRALVSGGARCPPASPVGSSCYPRDPCATLRWPSPRGIDCQSSQRETQPIPPAAWLYGVVFFQVFDRIPFLLSV
jgi:hypothetical protein